MKKYIVWLLLVLYTITVCFVYIPKITEKQDLPENHAYEKAKEVHQLYSNERDKQIEENRAYLSMQQSQEEPKKQTNEAPQQDTYEDKDIVMTNLAYYMLYGLIIVLSVLGVILVILDIEDCW